STRRHPPSFPTRRSSDLVTTTYEGTGGVWIGSPLRKLVYALYFRDANLLLSSALGERSAILYRREIVERVQRVAPFLLLDGDPRSEEHTSELQSLAYLVC